jgi:hypothetical protein
VALQVVPALPVQVIVALWPSATVDGATMRVRLAAVCAAGFEDPSPHPVSEPAIQQHVNSINPGAPVGRRNSWRNSMAGYPCCS